MKFQTVLLLSALGFANLHAKEVPAPAAEEKPAATEEKPAAASPTGDAARLESLNKLASETLTQETSGLRAEIAKLKLERELIS